jgi:hypothetical protein
VMSDIDGAGFDVDDDDGHNRESAGADQAPWARYSRGNAIL